MPRPFARVRIAPIVAVAAAGSVGLAGGNARAQSEPRAAWSAVGAPAPGPARVIGGSGAACLAGARPLPLEGPGYQAVDASRRRHFGHPALLGYVVDLGRQVEAARLGTMLVGDMAQPRGGPMSSGHVSHQGGLDVDLWFRLDVPLLPRDRREGIAQPPVVDPATGRPDPARWGASHAELIRLAASDPRVSRVFVGAAIKRDLCERAWPERGWLRVVRPWPGHDDHLHVRLRCPTDSPDCLDQPPLPAGEGCAPVELAAALARDAAQARRPSPGPRGILPAACQPLLAPTDSPAATVRLAGDVIKLEGNARGARGDRSIGASSRLGRDGRVGAARRGRERRDGTRADQSRHGLIAR